MLRLWLENHSMDLIGWMAQRHGIVHRQDAARAGFAEPVIRRFRNANQLSVLNRQWLTLDDANPDLVAAATHGARLACISAASHRGWWIPESSTPRLHLTMGPNARGAYEAVRHWNQPLTPRGRGDLVDSPVDALRNIASCLPMDAALTVWESAIKHERLDPAALRLISWRNRTAEQLANECTGLADSGIETFLVTRMARRGVHVKQQVWIAGRPVDGLIGDWLVLQTDGQEHHSSPTDRARDGAHDAELTLRGYTVLRFTYAQVIRDWPETERIILRAMAAGLHLHPRRSR